jgi:hypothetical protein
MTETELLKRLEKLERDNRRMKRAGLIAVVTVAALELMAATRPVPQKVTAHELDIVDAAGRVRIRAAMSCPKQRGCHPLIYLTGDSGPAGAVIQPGLLAVMGQRGNALLSGNELDISGMQNGRVTGGGATLAVGFTLSSGQLLHSTGGLSPSSPKEGGSLSLSGKDGEFVYAVADSPAIQVQDAKGFAMDLGSAPLVTAATGETHQTSAASIVMFGSDKRHHVIWQAP